MSVGFVMKIIAICPIKVQILWVENICPISEWRIGTMVMLIVLGNRWLLLTTFKTVCMCVSVCLCTCVCMYGCVFVYLCTCVCMYACEPLCGCVGVCRCTCGCQRITYNSCFSSSTVWVLGLKLRSLKLAVHTFTHWAVFPTLDESLVFLIYKCFSKFIVFVANHIHFISLAQWEMWP